MMADSPGDPIDFDRQFYGRRRGRVLRIVPRTLTERRLPALRLDLAVPAPPSLGPLFATPVTDFHLEIGFGSGEHLAWLAERHSGVGFIGVEPFVNGVAALVGHIDARGLDNIRIHDHEVAPLLHWLPDSSIGRTYVLFPDPWPKRRHRKRRLIGPETLRRLARVMRSGAELRVASDVDDYVATTLAAIRGSAEFHWPVETDARWRDDRVGWPPTRYERKAIAAGRRCRYFRFVRR